MKWDEKETQILFFYIDFVSKYYIDAYMAMEDNRN